MKRIRGEVREPNSQEPEPARPRKVSREEPKKDGDLNGENDLKQPTIPPPPLMRREVSLVGKKEGFDHFTPFLDNRSKSIPDIGAPDLFRDKSITEYCYKDSDHSHEGDNVPLDNNGTLLPIIDHFRGNLDSNDFRGHPDFPHEEIAPNPLGNEEEVRKSQQNFVLGEAFPSGERYPNTPKGAAGTKEGFNESELKHTSSSSNTREDTSSSSGGDCKKPAVAVEKQTGCRSKKSEKSIPPAPVASASKNSKANNESSKSSEQRRRSMRIRKKPKKQLENSSEDSEEVDSGPKTGAQALKELAALGIPIVTLDTAGGEDEE
mmetsp:Transcript_24990/g.34768  ORF Transcript_24990/g.34768 Transcript_24990/m.34768 type:complete len:320 (+) Transcript_24990:156-1115(+)|eukprot:CAMPEP_0184483112 /NCGR_PEP_ID=MMETSP0113_2-20130426/4727_1 /TAXON_ID=91329 /ORGANISM="Norrisiella sphaerica, Strain BC52" /LENGTH=319 /DNA_ID=CAMNT_0026863295 /DNA_START=65 /DNA_END=1024 /DNA_ORIENTATION=-